MIDSLIVKTHSASSGCPIARALEILGDQWTLLVLRDLFVGKCRFAEFLESPEAIASSILTNRLKRLESNGLVVRQRYQVKPNRYEYQLTEAGLDTLPILQNLARWAGRHLAPLWHPPEGFFELTPTSWRKDWLHRPLKD